MDTLIVGSMKKTLFAILLSLMLAGCVSNSFYSQYLDYQKKDGGAHRYFAMAQTIDGQEALFLGSNTRVYLKENVKKECEKRSGKTCEVTYDDNNYIGKIVQQQDRTAEPQIGFGEAFMKGWREAGEKQEEENRIEKERKLKVEQDKELAYINTLKNHCRAFGFNEGTDALANCMMNRHNQNIADEENRRRASAEAWDSVTKTLERINQRGQPQPSWNLNCTSRRVGNTVNTECN